MFSPRLLVVSIDGLAPRHITRDRMPVLTGFAQQGAACWSARTVVPSWTLPAHMSMVRGVDPVDHGVLDNTPVPPGGTAPSFLRVLRQRELRTAVVHSWSNMDLVFEADCAQSYVMLDDGYDPAIDHAVTAQVARLAPDHDVIFAYHVTPDLCGHEHGWDSAKYVEAVAQTDRNFGALLAAVGPDWAVMVTTDHGGLGRNHGGDEHEVVETFVAARAPSILPASRWSAASVLDVAPTAAALCGVDAAREWSGRSLVGEEQLTVDWLMQQLKAMESHRYGEDVTMLEHALQTAAHAEKSDLSAAMSLAALLHDIGHMGGEAGEWGLPDHAAVGARVLQQILPAAVTEPIRLHVPAKRWLVAREPGYAAALSPASQITLEQQGGPFTDAEATAYEQEPFAQQAIALRRWDDQGKDPGTSSDLEQWRSRLAAMLAPAPTVDAAWARDACRCPMCRDPHNDQHLINVDELAGWRVIDQTTTDDELIVELVCHSGAAHTCRIPHSASGARGGLVHRHIRWGSAYSSTLMGSAVAWPASQDRLAVDEIASQVATAGVSLVRGVPVTNGAVLEVARSLGHVRETNYGTLFEVVTLPNPTNLAYSNKGLPLHTDNPYRDPCPTVQLLHCLVPAETGGATRISDGFNAAEQLRLAHPDHFATLSQTMLTFRFHDADVDLRARRPMIEVDAGGTVRAVHVNHRSMEAPAPDFRSGRFYEAYACFQEVLSSEDAVVELSMVAGDLLVFDNRRVLHARTPFAGSARRHLQGCYIDMDAVESRARRTISAATN